MSQSLTSLPLDVLTPSLTPGKTFGSLTVGAVVLGILYGITSVQTYIYYNYTRRPGDGKVLSALVMILWLFDTIQMVLSAHLAYHYLVTWVYDPTILTRIVWSGAVHLMFGSLGDTMVTCLLAHRVWKLGGKLWPLVFIIPPALISFICFEVMGVLCFIITDFTKSQKTERWIWELAYSAEAFSDIAITVSLCAILLNRRTVFQKTNSIINALIVYSVNTCLLTSSIAVASLITYVVLPRSFFWLTLAAVLPKLMLNSLLALLNSRDAMRNKLTSEDPVSIHLSRFPTEASSMPQTTVELRPTHDAPSDMSKETTFLDIGSDAVARKDYA